MGRILLATAAITLYSLPSVFAQSSADALLVVAHGSPTGGEWNTQVTRMIDTVDWPGPKGVAFLMTPSKEETLPQVAARLDQPGVRRIITVPLLISSFSNHYEEIRYYAGELKHAHVHGAGEPLTS